MSIDLSKLETRRGYLEGEAASAAPEEGRTVTDYKQQVVARYLSLNPSQVEQRLGGSTFEVTRKYDGELAVVFFDGTTAFTVNTGGRIRTGLPVHEEIGRHLRAAGIGSAVIPAELHVVEDAGRTRVFDVSSALADPAAHSRLRLAPFEIVSLDGEPWRPGSYAETHQRLADLFDGDLARPVERRTATSRSQVAAICAEWVDGEGAEGLVVRPDIPVVYKIKPVYTLDVAVIGYSENPETAGQVRSLLVALTSADGRYQPVGHVGSGLSEESRSSLHAQLSPLEVPSTYIDTDANHVAFHMVKPELVIEIRVNDVLFESGGGPIRSPLLEFETSWERTGTTSGVSIIHPVLERLREDKAAHGVDVRLSQVDHYCAWPVPPQDESAEAPASTVLRREVWTKTLGGKLMVQKFVVWRTNKEGLGYPAFVLAYTNFSSGRAEPLAHEVRISSSEDQILDLADDLVATKVKSGWVQAQG